MTLDPRCEAALALAKRVLAEGEKLGVGLLLDAVYHATEVGKAHPELSAYFAAPVPRRETPLVKVPVADELKPVLQRALAQAPPPDPEQFFLLLARSDAGRATLQQRGLSSDALESALTNAAGAPPPAVTAAAAQAGWRTTVARDGAVRELAPYGRLLTDGQLPGRAGADFGSAFKALVRTLSRMRRRNAIIIGFPGTGKSALVYELSRRIVAGDASVPPRLRECDIFELNPTFLRSGASHVGEYEERVKILLEALRKNPRIILFVDEIHSMFQSAVHGRGPFSDANESFKGALGRGEIVCIGCTTVSEYRAFIEPDQAFARRFSIVRVDPPSAAATVDILRARLPQLEEYYRPLRIPPEILTRVVALTEEHLPARAQPDKSIQLLDEACAYCITTEPPLPELAEAALLTVLEDLVGHGLLHRDRLTEDSLFAALRAKILGQDAVLRQLARAVVAGLGDWRRSGGPRGVYLFAGPTGVGKTETALALARVLGGDRDNLLRVDCNTLQGSGLDSGPIVNRLLGAPPGYIGYAQGQGGILSRIRDLPECIVLFDELEKADPSLGRFLLQVLDDGRLEDVDGNTLDFRRAFIIMTSNLGCEYDQRALGFAVTTAPGLATPRVDEAALKEGLRRAGLGEEFLGRIGHYFLFEGLAPAAVREILVRQIGALRDLAQTRGLALTWSDALVEHLVAQWQPRFGARHLGAVLRHRVTEQLGVAQAHGELDAVTSIHLDVLPSAPGDADRAQIGLVERQRQSETLTIRLR